MGGDYYHMRDGYIQFEAEQFPKNAVSRHDEASFAPHTASILFHNQFFGSSEPENMVQMVGQQDPLTKHTGRFHLGTCDLSNVSDFCA